MDEFQQVGKVLGSLKALMVLKHEIQINQRQCCLLFDIFSLAFETISDEIRQHLRLEERNNKWKPLEQPLKELHKVFKDGEDYIRYCLDIKDWWGKAISLHLNRDCVDYHIHNLLCCFSVVIEAIEAASETSVSDPEDMQKRRSVLTRKYETTDCNDPNFFQWMFGKQYLVSKDICTKIDIAIKEEKWLLAEKIREKKGPLLSKQEQRLADMLLKKLNASGSSESVKLLPNSILVGANDYIVKRRLGLGEGRMKEVQWLGESFAVRTFFGELEPLNQEISLVLSLSHPNILQHLCGFYDEEKRECNLVMELMNKSLKTYIKENNSQRKSLPFPTLPAAVDIMLQIARGMEYLHSKKVYHGELNPSNVLLKSRNSSKAKYLQAKVTGFGLSSIKNFVRSPTVKGEDPVIWYAPEVLADQEQFGQKRNPSKYTDKADVYSFGMLCFELLTGKVPFEDSHLQGDKMARNIRAGERPLFPHPSPKYLANLTRKCWHPNPDLRPSFNSITRILRYIKKNLIINPDHGDPESPPPLVDYCDIETGYLKKFPEEETNVLTPSTQVPFQLFAYRLIQKEKISGSFKDKIWYSFNEDTLAHSHRPASICGHEHLAAMDDLFLVPSDRRSVSSEIIESRYTGGAMDQRTVISEIPHRRTLVSDQRSVGSVSPGRKFSFATNLDRKSFSGVTPERIFSSTQTAEKSTTPASSSTKKFKFPETSDKEIFITSENKTSEVKTASLSPSSEPEENGSKADPPQVSHDTQEKKTSRRKIIHKKKLSEIPEQIVCYTGTSKPDSTKKASTNKNDPSPAPNNSAKRSTSNKKLREAITMNGSGVSKDYSPRNSPARIFKTSTTPAAASPPRILRMSSAPAASPPRTFKSNTLPKLTSSASKELLLSPMASPLNPACTRCTKGNKESTVPPGASPRRMK